MTEVAPRVLVVEDDTSLRRVVELNLSAQGYQVDTAATAAEALSLAKGGPDLIIVDLGLPDMDGLDLIARLRATVRAPIVVVSARDPHLAGPAARAAGAADYLPKPFAIDQLVAKVRAALHPSTGR